MMTWIEDLEKLYQDYYKDTLIKLGFSRYKEGNDPGKGSSFKFKNNFFAVQIFKNGTVSQAEISPLGTEQFKAVDKYNSLLNSNGTKLDHKAQAAFILENFEKLKTALDKDNFQKTLKSIDGAR
jgi:hypothetical protein